MKHQFVEVIPELMEVDTLYISLEYNIAIHKCASGCGHDVVTPLSPAEWAITYDGASVSLAPSIGNWSLPCQSHYWIRNGKVRWASSMTAAQIEKVRIKDVSAKEREYGGSVTEAVEVTTLDERPMKVEGNSTVDAPPARHWWVRLAGWLDSKS